MQLASYYNPTTRVVQVRKGSDAAPGAPYVVLGELTHETGDDNLSGAQKNHVSHAIFQHVQEQLYLKHDIQNMQSISIVPGGTFKLVERFWVDRTTSSIRPGGSIQITPKVEPADATIDGFYISSTNADLIQVDQTEGQFSVTFVGEGETVLHVGIENTSYFEIIPIECYSNRRQTAVNPDGMITIGVSPTTVNVIVGATQQLNAAATNSGTLVYTSAAPGTATVSSSGLITGVAAGSTTVRVALQGNAAVFTDVPVTVTAGG